MANETILFMSSTHKGDEILKAVKAAGAKVLLLIEEELKDEAWPWDAIDDLTLTPNLARYQDVINTVTWMCRGQQIDLILPLDEFEVELVSMLREHLRLPGMGVTLSRRFRDKLVMRELADRAKIPVPAFQHVLNYDDLRDFMNRIEPPWMLKPRTEAGAMGIRKIHEPEQLWRTLDDLGDRQSYYLLEEFLPGEVYHVDSLVVDDEIQFVSRQKYAEPPIDIYQGGGVFSTYTVPAESVDGEALTKINKTLIKTLGMVNGVTHAEFIKAHKDQQFYFLEIAARVGGAFVSDTIEQATGINLWQEWGRLELALLRGESYQLPPQKQTFAGLVLTLARQERPDTQAYDAPEIVWRVDKPYHAGLIVVSDDHERMLSLVKDYRQRFLHDFSTSAPPMDAQRTGYNE